MANENSAPQDKRFQITTRSGEIINLDKDTVKRYLTDNVEITNSEFTMFFQLCKVHKVNPFLKEAYIIKYGNSPATIVLDYKVLQQAAEENKAYRGMKHGVIVEKGGEIIERNGEYKLPDETLVAGWCEVYRADRDQPTRVTAMFNEFASVKKDGTVNANWAGKPCFMICKVAKAQALREAFPNLFGSNVYTAEEATTFSQPKDETPSKTSVSNSIIADDEAEEAAAKAEEAE